MNRRKQVLFAGMWDHSAEEPLRTTRDRGLYIILIEEKYGEGRQRVSTGRTNGVVGFLFVLRKDKWAFREAKGKYDSS